MQLGLSAACGSSAAAFGALASSICVSEFVHRHHLPCNGVAKSLSYQNTAPGRQSGSSLRWSRTSDPTPNFAWATRKSSYLVFEP